MDLVRELAFYRVGDGGSTDYPSKLSTQLPASEGGYSVSTQATEPVQGTHCWMYDS